MSGMLIGEFSEPKTMLTAARRAKTERYRLIDAFSPFPIEGMAELLGSTSTRLRVYMFIGAMAFAAFAYGIEGWSAVYNYPINSGGRPFNSWPAFMLFPFALGIFGAALTGLIGMLVQCGLPKLHHPLFDIEEFERVTQDAFMLALERPDRATEKLQIVAFLRAAGARKIWDLET